MVIFDRPEFKAGVIVCKEIITLEDGKQKINVWRFHVKDKGKQFQFENEPYMLTKYPVLFKKI